MRRALLTLALALPLLAACQLSLPGRDRAPATAAPADLMGEAITTTTLDAPAPTPSAAPSATSASPSPTATAEPAEPPATAAEATADPTPLPEPLATPIPKSPSQIACEDDGGVWSRTGNGDAMACIRKTRDSGRRCDSKTDCQGECLARSRTCAPFTPMFGCNAVLMDNGAEVTLCLD
ncbi:hypothetical protein [Tabrizicola sp. M-4]|uniref:hypothetical protein n=1 Tax=Tabrizicola sp. M-4 TaxID=3055847 RepID=UPI003DA9BD43